jgi:hypothetical protein
MTFIDLAHPKEITRGKMRANIEETSSPYRVQNRSIVADLSLLVPDRIHANSTNLPAAKLVGVTVCKHLLRPSRCLVGETRPEM